MYTQSWDKYLPVIRILLKRSLEGGEQSFKLNIPDFEKSGSVRKTAPKFSLQFNNGKVKDTIGKPQIAKDLSEILMNDPVVVGLFMKHEFQISLNTRFQLSIQFIQHRMPELQPVDSVTE